VREESPEDRTVRMHELTPEHKTARNPHEKHSPAVANTKSHNSTTMQKTGVQSKSQMMVEMLRIKEDIERKKDEELSKVKTRKLEQLHSIKTQDNPAENFTDRELDAEAEQEELFKQELFKDELFEDGDSASHPTDPTDLQ